MPHHHIIGNRLRLAAVLLAFMVLAMPFPSAAQPAQAPPAQAPAPTSLDQILKQLSTWDGGVESAAFWRLRDYVYARKDDPAGRAECEAKILQFLKGPATAAARMAAGRHLRLIGGDPAVPALQAMLLDDRLADVALYGLRQIPGRVADQALVQTLSKAAGPTKIAIIAVLGERRSPEAVPALAPLLGQPTLAGPAAIALGAIADDTAANALAAAWTAAKADGRPVIASSLLECAERRRAAGNNAGALQLYELVAADTALPVPIRRAAAMGHLSTAGSRAEALLMGALTGSDPTLREAAIAQVAAIVKPDGIGPVCDLLPRLPEDAQVGLMAVLAGYPKDRVLPVVLQSMRSGSPAVRIAALKTLASVGDESAVPLLVQMGAGVKGPEQAAARVTLGSLRGRAVDEAIVARLAQKPDASTEAELLLAVADRRVFAAKPAVTRSLESPAPAVRVQALRSLRAIGTPSDMPAVLDRLLQTEDEVERSEMETTVAALAQKIANPDGRAGAIMAKLATEKGPAARARLIETLPLIGDSSSLPLLRAALEDPSPDVFEAAVRAITAWPTSAARDDVLRLARDLRNETLRLLAITGLVRIIRLDRYREPASAVADLRQAAGFSWRPEEQRLVLAALALFPCQDALDLARSFLRDTALAAEAQAAVNTLTARMAKMPGRDQR